MNILAFSDLHSSAAALRAVERKSKKADLLVCAGDFTVFEQGMSQVVRRLDSLGKPVLLVHGNHESEEAARAACEKSRNLVFLHKREHRVGGVRFIGYGGGGFALREKGLERFVRKYVKQGKGLALVTHAPPYGTRLDYIYGEHRGCRSTQEFIRQAKPLLAVCGHFHETAGVRQKVGRTLVVNAGPKGMMIPVVPR